MSSSVAALPDLLLDGEDEGSLAFMAYHQLLAGRFEAAALFYGILMRGFPKTARWQLGRAYCLLRLQQWQEAQNILRRLGHQTAQEQAVSQRLLLRAKLLAKTSKGSVVLPSPALADAAP